MQRTPIGVANPHAAAVTTSARVVLALQHHRVLKTRKLSLIGLMIPTALTGRPDALPSLASHAAALSIFKCLPFELPTLQAAVLTASASHKGAAAGRIWAAASQDEHLERYQVDMYGVEVAGQAVLQPRMRYSNTSAPSSFAAVAGGQLKATGTCMITGSCPL